MTSVIVSVEFCINTEQISRYLLVDCRIELVKSERKKLEDLIKSRTANFVIPTSIHSHLHIAPIMLGTKELESIKDFLVELAHEAGGMIMAAHPSTESSGSKKNGRSAFNSTFAAKA